MTDPEGPADLRVKRLRALVDWSPYQPTSEAPAWLLRLNQLSSGRGGVLALLGPSGLGVARDIGRPSLPSVDPAALYLAALADYLRNSSRLLSVSIPPGGQHLPLLLASASVMADTLAGRRAGEVPRGVLLVSPDLELRSRYCSLAVDQEPLDSAHPGSRMRPDGARVSLDGKRQLQDGGVCFFLPGLELPKRISMRPALILLDLRYARWSKRAEALAAWAVKIAGNAGVLGLYTLGDLDSGAALRQAGFREFAFDHAAVDTCDWPRLSGDRDAPPDEPMEWGLADTPGYLDRDHEIVELDRPADVQALVDGIGRLLQEHRQLDTPDLRRARWLLATLRQLPAPLPWYEEAARALGRSTIRRMINYLGARSARIPDELGPVVQTLRMSLDQLYANVEDQNPRSAGLAKAISNAVEAYPGRNVLVLVRDAVMERATENWLELDAFSESRWIQRVEVRACPGYERLHSARFAIAIINGALPRRYRWIGGSLLAPFVEFLCYPEECDIVGQQMGSFYDLDRRSMNTARDDVLALLAPRIEVTKTAAEGRPSASLILKRPPERREQPTKGTKTRLRKVAGGLRSLKEAMDAVDRAAAEADRAAAEFVPIDWPEDSVDEETLLDDLQDMQVTSEADDVPCIRLDVNSSSGGGGRLYLPAAELVEAVRPTKAGDILRLAPDELQPGDVVLRIEDGRRAGLFDRIVEVAERQPRFQNLSVYRSRWRASVHQLAQKYSAGGAVDYTTMLSDLQTAGSPIKSELALRWWIKDMVIGPERVASITAVGKVVGDESMVRTAREFDGAFRRIRGLRQGIGRRLSSSIRRSFRHVKMSGPAEVGDDLDVELGLPLDELVESIELAEVLEIDRSPQLMPAYLVDRLLRSD